ncbi:MULTISPECIES: hypothetical protein [Actinosynnema]|uniref:hypothetical protein n=1 Tax=Actinosynnema TaxID=40566 RepID=UPI0020A5F84F|nr:hypothetical protein [Actinosynnema pretiosum]MCP2097510.1 hypothetical protein [Actinosynnema pretiosum]
MTATSHNARGHDGPTGSTTPVTSVSFDKGTRLGEQLGTISPPVPAHAPHDQALAGFTEPVLAEHPARHALHRQGASPPSGDTPPTDTPSSMAQSTTPFSNMPPIPPADPAEPKGLHTVESDLVLAARRPWPGLPGADIDAAVEAGMLAAAAAAVENTVRAQQVFGGDRPTAPESIAHTTTGAVATAAAALQRQGLPPDVITPVNWTGFGAVIPVLAGSPGAGASVLAAVLADVLQLGRHRVLLVDPADPPRSGLSAAARAQGPWLAHPHPQVRIRFSWRAQALLAQLETCLPVLSPGMVPPPRWWRPPMQQPHATVVDLGHDPWRVTAHPLAGAGAWLRRGIPQPRPLVVVRPSRPSLLHAEQVLARLDHWISAAVATAPVQLVVMGTKRWPTGVAGAAGRRVSALLPDAVFVPHDPDLAAAGITAEVTPPRLRQAITPVLRRWGLLPDTATHSRRSSTRRRS